MSELDLLMQQKKEIEQRIRELKNKAAQYGKAVCDVERYPTDLPDRWYIALEVDYCNNWGTRRSPRKRSIINGLSRQEVINQIPDVIRDLQGLYDQENGK